jgi:hypothetical protein
MYSQYDRDREILRETGSIYSMARSASADDALKEGHH